MLREFTWLYAKHALMIGPVVALVVFIPPSPMSVKFQMFGSFFVVLLLVELVHLAIVLQNGRRERREVESLARVPMSDEILTDDSRKARRKREQVDKMRSTMRNPQ